MLTLTVLSVLVVVFIGITLYTRSEPLIREYSLVDLLLTEGWKPFKGIFGFLPFIMGSLWITSLAVLIAVPLCILTAIHLSEYANRRVKHFIYPLIDLLAGIPSVIYGVWGVLVVVPFVADVVGPGFKSFTTGYSVLAGGIVLSVMIFPLVINVIAEVFNTIPQELRDASLSLGATRWQTVKYVLVRRALPGIVAAVVLGVSRAFGETIAVLMVCGNIPASPSGILDSAYPLPALIANNFGDMFSIPRYDSALLFAALLIFIVIFVLNTMSRIILRKIERRVS